MMDDTPAPSIDLDATPVQGQLMSAVLNLQGGVVRGQLPQHEAALLYQMFVETGNLKSIDNFQRLTVTFSSVRYVVARDESHIYVVQTRPG
jgi:hypothetical protein